MHTSTHKTYVYLHFPVAIFAFEQFYDEIQLQIFSPFSKEEYSLTNIGYLGK